MLVVKRLVLIIYISMFFTFSDQQWLNHDLLNIEQNAVALSALSSNRYTQVEDDLRLAENLYVSLEGYEKIASNDLLELYIKEEDLSFRVLNKDTNYLWGSSFFLDYALLDEDDLPLYPELYDEGDRGFRSQVWRNRVISPLFIGYYTSVDTNPQFREESFFQSDLSTFDLTILDNGFKAQLRFGISQIQATIVVTIDDDGLIIEVPQEEIIDGQNAKLSRLSPYPFIGATKGDRIPGYVFVPDGIGALIRFEKDGLFTNVYEKPFYGFDVGTARTIIDRTGFVRAEQGLFASVYGMVHGINQHGFLAHVEQGAPYASLIVYPENLTTDFYWTSINYQYRNVYRQPLNQSQTNAIVRLQDELNPIHLRQKYIFLSNDDANYVGMANAYREILKQKGFIDQPLDHQDIMLHLDILAAENKRALFGRSTFVMTTVAQFIDMLDDLNEANIYNIVANYLGTSRSGLTGSSFNEYPFLRDLGSKQKFIELNEREEMIYYQLETTRSYVGTKGYTPYDLMVRRNLLNFESEDTFGKFFYIHPNQALERVETLQEQMDAYHVKGASFQSIGQVLYSSHGNDYLARHEAIDVYQEMMELFPQNAIYSPHDYMFFADHLFNFVMYNAQQAKFSDTVPFMSYVLAGYKPMFARYGNFFSNTQNELLRMIDYHLYPSFYLTHESAYLLLDTGSKDIYTSKYDIWTDEVKRQYHYVNDALKQVIGAHIINREVLSAGVNKVTYSNGVIIYINYSANDVQGIPANSYMLGGI